MDTDSDLGQKQLDATAEKSTIIMWQHQLLDDKFRYNAD